MELTPQKVRERREHMAFLVKTLNCKLVRQYETPTTEEDE